MGGTVIRGSQAVPQVEKVSLTRIGESEYRRRVGSSRSEHQKIGETWVELFFLFDLASYVDSSHLLPDFFRQAVTM